MGSSLWGPVLCKLSLRTSAIQFYTAPRHSTLYRLHKLHPQTGRCRSTSYTKCTVPTMHMPVLNPIGSSVAQNEFSYTYCKVLYSTLTYNAVYLHKLHTQTAMSRSASYSRCTVPITRMPLLKAMGGSVAKKFSYTRCMVLYSTLTYLNVQAPQAVHTNCEVL